jgi:hypothetical protein
VWTAWGGRSTPEAHLSDLERELNLETLINRQEWLGFTTPQQAYAWRTNELNQRKQMNYAEWAGYQTADQYLSYLQKERSGLSDLNAVLLRRADIYKANADAALGYANALQGTHKSAGQLGEGIDLTGISQFNSALVNLPDTVTTVLAVDDSAALAELAKYEALLRGVPRAETTSTTDVITAAYAMGGAPIPSALPKSEVIPVSFGGPYQEQFAAIVAEVARLHELRAEIPVKFDLPDKENLSAWISKTIPVVGPVSVLGAGGSAGGGGGGPPPVAPAPGAEPPDDAAGKWAALAAAQKAEAAASDDAASHAAAAVPKLDSLSSSVYRLYGRWGLLRREVTLFGGLFGSTALIGAVGLWHIALDAIIETLAILVPAVVTATAGLLGWGAAAYQSGQQVYNQMKNVLTVSSALNTTVPPLTGNFQKLVDAVRPQAFQLFGDALDLMNSKTGVFQNLIMQTGRVLDTFGARIVVDMQQGGKGLQTFFDTGAKVLGMLGQIALNIGHAFANLVRATEITHIAEDLLAVVSVLSKLLDIITKLPAPVLALVLGLHGLQLWGGLAVTWISKLAVGLVSMFSAVGPLNGVMSTLADKLGATDKQLVSIAGHSPAVKAVADAMGQNAAQVAQFATAAGKGDKSVQELAASTSNGAVLAERYGSGLEKAGQEAVNLAIAAGATEQQVAKVASSFSSAGNEAGFFSGLLARVGGVAGLATIGLGALAAAAAAFAVLSLRAKDSAQQWINSINSGLASQSLFTVIGKNVADLAAVTGQLSSAQGLNAQAVHELTGAQTELSTNLGLELSRVGQVSRAYGVDMVGALQLLNLAGVKTSDLFTRQGIVWATDLQKVKGLVDGYQAMGQQIGTVGSDLNVLLVSESEQVKSMQTLNSAWDAWLQTVTGGESTFVKVQQDFLAVDTAGKVAGSSMTGLNKQSLDLRAAFIGMVPDAGKVLDAIRAQTATMSSGAAGGALMTRATRDLAAEMIPLAGNSADARAAVLALAQEANPSITTWQKLTQWVGRQGAAGAANDLQGILFKLAIPVSDLQQDAAKLSNTLQGDLNPAMAKAEFDALGGQKAFSAFASDLTKFGPGSQVTIAAGQKVAEMLLSIDKNSATAKSQFVAWAESMGLSQKQADALWQKVSAGQKPLADMRSGLASSATASDKLSNSGFFAQRGDTFRTNMQQMGTWFSQTLPHAIGTAAGAVAGAGKDVGSFFATAGREGASFFTTLGRDVASFAGSAWSKAWQNVAAPAIGAFTSIEHFVTSSFDTWWKSHGLEVEQVWKSVTDNLSLWWDNFTGGLERAWNAVISWFKGNGDVSKPIRAGFDQLTTALKPVIDTIEGMFKLAWTVIEAGAKTAWDVIAAAGKTAWDALMTVFKVAWAALIAVLKSAWDLGVGALKATWDLFVGVINVALDLITGHWSKAWHDMKQTWDQINNAIDQAFRQTWNAIFGFLKASWDAFGTFFKQLWNNSIALLRQLWNTWWGWFDNVIIGNFRTFFTRTIPGWFRDFTNFAKNSWIDSWHQFDNVVIGNLRHFFTSTVPGWWDDFSRFAGNAASGVSRAIVAAFKGALSTADTIINTPINFINNDILKHLPGGIHIPTLPTHFASGGAMRFAAGSVPGTGDEDGTHIVAMGGEYMVRKPARMALEAAYGRGFMNMLNQADSWLSSGSRGHAASQQMRPGINMATGGLVDPIGPGLRPERVDMGVDYGGAGTLRALGSGQITSVYNSGWPGGTFIDLRLNPPYGTGYWYYAEDIAPSVRVGQAVSAGQTVGHATGGPSGIEVGWASGVGGQTAAARDGQQNKNGDPGEFPTAWGVAASNLIGSLGGPKGIVSGPVHGGTGGLGGAIAAIWQNVEGLLDSAGTGLGDLIKPLTRWVSGGAKELLKLAQSGSKAIFDFIWSHTVQPMVDVAPNDTIPGAVGRYGAAEIKAGIDNFLGGKDQAAQGVAAAENAAANALGTSGGAIGPVSGPADAGPGQAQNYALSKMGAHGWGSDQFKFLQELWTRESGWSRFARNASSGAYGIPQALPPTKLPAAGQASGGSHASPQIDWGMGYVKGRYGTPQGAWAHELSAGWYPSGGVVSGDGASLMGMLFSGGGAVGDWDGEVRASGGELSSWPPLQAAMGREETDFWGLMGRKLPSTATAAQRSTYASWQRALEAQQYKAGVHGAYGALNAHASSPASQTGVQWKALTGNLNTLLREQEGTGIPGGINPPGTPANSGYPAWKYLRSPWQTLLDQLRATTKAANTAQTQWGSQYSLVPLGSGTTGQTNTDSPEWDSASAALDSAVRAEMTSFWKLMGAKLPAKGPTSAQRTAFADWTRALEKQQLKTIGLGKGGAYNTIESRLKAPNTITAGEWSAFTGDLSYLTREEEGTGAGGINPPGTPSNSGWTAWKYEHADWQALLTSLRTVQARANSARNLWGTLYGPGHLPSTPGPARPPAGTPVPNGLVNVMPEATMGGPSMPVRPGSGTPDMGFAAGGGLDQVASMFSGGLNPGGVMLPVVLRHGIPDSVLNQLSGAGSSASGSRDYPRRLSEAGGSHYGPALNVEQLNINNPLPQRPSDSIAHAANRLAFLGGRMN